MNKQAIATVLAFGLAAAVLPSAVAQDEGNTPPVINSVTWEISKNVFGDPRGPYLPFEAFDPAADIARELDILRPTVTVFDPDFGDEGDDEVFVLRQSIAFFLIGYPTPEPPPIPEDFDAFQPEEGDGFSPATGTEVVLPTDLLEFTIPTFEGKNQARLRGLIDWDVLWLVRFFVSNEQDPGCETDQVGVIIRCEEPVFVWEEFVFAIEHPELAPPNPPVFADAGADQIAVVDSTVTLDGSRTFDAFNIGFNVNSGEIFEKDVLTYAWEWISGPVRVEPTQANQNDPIATVVLSELGTYIYRLTVDDNFNLLPNTDSVTINVVSEIPENRPPRAFITGSVSPIVQGSIITLDGSTSADPDNDTLTFLWRQTDELGTTLTNSDDVSRFFQPLSGVESAAVTWQATEPGEFFFRLIVSDGEMVDSATVAIEVVAAPIAGVQATAGDSSLTGAAADGGSTQNAPMPAPVCGGSLLPLGLLPLLLFLMRGRNR